MNLIEKQLKKEYVYNGRIISLRSDTALLPNGNTATREVVEHPGGVGVIALTENKEILMVKQYRYPYSEVTLEIPAGKRDKGEEVALTGKRELLEETGATAKTYIPIGQLYPTPGYCDEIIWLFAAKDLTFAESQPDEDEFLECERVPLSKAVEMVMNNEIKDAKTIIAVLKLKNLLESNAF